MAMKRKVAFIVALLFLFGAVGCASFRDAVQRDWKEGTAGAVAGAIIGVAVTADNATSNIAGATIGAATGYLLGVGVKEGYDYWFKKKEKTSENYCPAYPVDDVKSACSSAAYGNGD